jgi:uncharacterized alpha-E superfamily protein
MPSARTSRTRTSTAKLEAVKQTALIHIALSQAEKAEEGLLKTLSFLGKSASKVRQSRSKEAQNMIKELERTVKKNPNLAKANPELAKKVAGVQLLLQLLQE